MPFSARRYGSARSCSPSASPAIVAFGNKAVERLFRDVSYLLYGVYALFIILALWKFGDRVPGGFAAYPQTSGWALTGLTYFGYNIIGAVVILPVLRHLLSDRDAVVAGRDRRAADDASRPALLHSDGRLLSRGAKRDACRRTSCSSASAFPPSTCSSRP